MKTMLTRTEGPVIYRNGQIAPAAPGEGDRDLTMAYRILDAHNQSGDSDKLRIRFDKLTSHDITYVGIIQTARASGLKEFPMPYVLTNCHNSLCAVGGTINEDDHIFGLSAARKYGGIFVPPHQAVIHQYAREQMAECGGMILGSDSHTRYGALGTLGVGEGGPELVKQLLGQTYDVARPEVVAVYLTGELQPGVGPQDVALLLVGETFGDGFVKNRVLEFIGPGASSMTMDERIGVDVMTTESTCLTSIWETDEKTKGWYETHLRGEFYKPLKAQDGALYDRAVTIDLSAVKPMIAMPFHPSNIYTIEDVLADPAAVLREVEEKAKISLGSDIHYSLQSKLTPAGLLVDQGVIAGCAGGGFENLCAAASILDGKSTGSGAFGLSVYPASMPVYMELMRNGAMAKLIDAGAVVKTCFCGPCFGAGDTPANNAFSIRHSTRNFPNREGSKLQEGQISSVALMDARSIAATAAAGGILTPADTVVRTKETYSYHYDPAIYEKRVADYWGRPEPASELVYGPNIKDWPQMDALPENLLLKVCALITDPVTTTDELIPSGETSSYRSNPEKLSSFALSRKVPAYVEDAKPLRAAQTAVREGGCAGQVLPELREVMHTIKPIFPGTGHENTGFGSVIYAVKPGDGSAREQAASCQKVLGGWANLANEYATKRYRSNLINWGMLPFVVDGGEAGSKLPFGLHDYLFFPGVRSMVENGDEKLTAYVVRPGKEPVPFTVELGALTEKERAIILAGCLINYNRV